MKEKINHLVIVESPTKARTIGEVLGPDFQVVASFGHVRDLPKAELGVDEETLEPKYVIPPKARKVITTLKKLIAQSGDVVIATDLDREGEAIGWHILQATDSGKGQKAPQKIQRITFHEITRTAISEALQHPRDLNLDLVNAQQARRVLDRLVGYKLSPLLWAKIARGLSAGRVQSVAVRLIVDREREIKRFTPQEYWTIEVSVEKGSVRFRATLTAWEGKKLEKLAIKTAAAADSYLADLRGMPLSVAAVASRESQRSPLPPFTTSTMQQEAARHLGWSAAQTMRVAQALYEEGHITYHRTDSVNLAASAIDAIRIVIDKTFGKTYLPEQGRQYKTKSRGAQEAHEAIRPVHPDRQPGSLSGVEPRAQRLYNLIWRRFTASQMTPARFKETTADLAAGKGLFRATGSTLLFDGFLKVWPTKMETQTLPDLTKGEEVAVRNLEKVQHFTEPPPRYNMASLIKTLEEHGIGRPSTYAPIISTIIGRNYVTATRGVFAPTDLGTMVTDLLVEHFPAIVDVSFTAHMEEELDGVAEGAKPWKGVVGDFYRPFAKLLTEKQAEIQKSDYQEVLDEKCPESGHSLVVKMGRYGKFIACSGFPECKYTRPLTVTLNLTCPECGQGQVVERKTRRGITFWGCSRYPDCKWATWKKPVEPLPAKT